MSRRVVVIGGSAAGMSAASVAKRRDRDLVVTVIEQGGAISYSACGIPYRLGGEVKRAMKDLVVLTPQQALREKGVDVRTRTRVTRIDVKGRTVHWQDLEDGKKGHETYDELVIATGSRAREGIPVAPECGVFTLRSLDDGIALEGWLDKQKPEKAVIVGAGFIGVEVAEAFLERGMQTRVIHGSRHVLSSMLDASIAETVARHMERTGIPLVTGERATGWVARDGTVHRSRQSPSGRHEDASGARDDDDARPRSKQGTGPDGSRVQGVLVGEKTIPADVVVVATGVVADSGLARQAGCRVREDGAVVVDDKMRTGVDGVWACGDLVAFKHRVSDESVFLPLALHANRSGRIAGTNLSGGDASFPGVLATAVTRFKELEIASTGITQALAGRLKLDVVVGDTKGQTRAAYMDPPGDVDVRMVAELTTGRLLGVQMVGGTGTALRIDTAAAMIWKGATLEDVERMDLAYNPPFSPVWDPLAIAARVTEKQRVPMGP